MVRHFPKLVVTLSCQPWLTSMEKKAEVTFEGVTYSSLAIINKEEMQGECQIFKRALFHFPRDEEFDK